VVSLAVLVTGANRGIGLEFVRQYAADSDRVFATARYPERAAELNKIAAGSDGRVTVHSLDVTDESEVTELAAALSGERIDILINNAGIDGAMSNGMPDYAAWAEVFRVNTMAPYRVALAFRPHLKKSKSPRLVNISSRLASIALTRGHAMDYSASKAALNHLMRALSIRWNKDGIVVVVLSPGWVKTDMGGAGAPLTPRESIAGMRRVIAGLTRADSGRFLGHEGEELPW
jgi:NAD(P)-dependent dehydrogenase (short-subunit alcohol dehydrogenase family)